MRVLIAMLAAALALAGATSVSARDEDATAPVVAASSASPLRVPLVFDTLLDQVEQLSETDDWEPFRPGVTAHWLYKEPNGGPAAVLLRYEPGARVPLHEHVGYEHIYILQGDQYDERGSYPAGSFVINPPGTRHSPGSKNGCIALLIYEKAVKFVAP
ncbi:MAG: transcription negative regulator ChrR [Planctomycetota bacterium]|nr:MAG: transcription negative regulator ChrR [Planctomycetota bacterium]